MKRRTKAKRRAPAKARPSKRRPQNPPNAAGPIKSHKGAEELAWRIYTSGFPGSYNEAEHLRSDWRGYVADPFMAQPLVEKYASVKLSKRMKDEIKAVTARHQRAMDRYHSDMAYSPQDAQARTSELEAATYALDMLRGKIPGRPVVVTERGLYERRDERASAAAARAEERAREERAHVLPTGLETALLTAARSHGHDPSIVVARGVAHARCRLCGRQGDYAMNQQCTLSAAQGMPILRTPAPTAPAQCPKCGGVGSPVTYTQILGWECAACRLYRQQWHRDPSNRLREIEEPTRVAQSEAGNEARYAAMRQREETVDDRTMRAMAARRAELQRQADEAARRQAEALLPHTEPWEPEVAQRRWAPTAPPVARYFGPAGREPEAGRFMGLELEGGPVSYAAPGFERFSGLELDAPSVPIGAGEGGGERFRGLELDNPPGNCAVCGQVGVEVEFIKSWIPVIPDFFRCVDTRACQDAKDARDDAAATCERCGAQPAEYTDGSWAGDLGSILCRSCAARSRGRRNPGLQHWPWARGEGY